MSSDRTTPVTLILGRQEFVDKLRDLPEVVVAKLPERVRGDPQIRQELARKMQSALVFSLFDFGGGCTSARIARSMTYIISSCTI